MIPHSRDGILFCVFFGVSKKFHMEHAGAAPATGVQYQKELDASEATSSRLAKRESTTDQSSVSSSQKQRKKARRSHTPYTTK